MSCNSQIHDELKSMEECTCPFCDRLLVEVYKVVESCCSGQDMKNVNGMNTCVNCGLVDGYVFVTEYFNLYDNMHKIRQKSVYHRKYHINNVLNGICYGNMLNLTNDQKNKIHKVFVEIDSIIPHVNKNRKRMIDTKFVIKQLFKVLGLPSEFVKTTKSKKTLEFYNRYWIDILSLKFDKIISILRQ